VAAGVTEIGARLSLLNSPAFIRNANAAAVAVNKLTASIEAQAAASGRLVASNADIAASNAEIATSTKVSTKVSTDAALASDAAIIKSRKAVTTATDDAAKAQKSALNTIANNPIVKKGALVLGAGLIAGAYEGLKQANVVQSKLTLLSTAAGVAQKDLPQYMKGALDISNQYGTSLSSVLDVMYRIKSASVGLHETNAQIIENSKSAVQLGVLQGSSMTPSQIDNTARVYGAFQNANLRGAQTPQQISATVNAAVGAGDVRMSDVIGMVGKGGLVNASAANMSAADMLGWMDTMTHFGGNPSNVGTLVSHAITQLSGVTKQSQQVQEMVGIAPGQLSAEIADPKVGLVGAFKTLKTSLQKFNPLSYFPQFKNDAPGRQSAADQLKAWGIMSQDEYKRYTTGGKLTSLEQETLQTQLVAKMFGGGKQMTPDETMIMEMLKAQGIIGQINQKATPQQYKKDLALAENTPLFQLKAAGTKWNNELIKLGTAMQGPAKIIAHVFGDLAGWAQENMGAVEVGIGAVAAFGVAFLGLRLASKIADLVKNFQDLGGPLARLKTQFSSVINSLTGGRFGTAAVTKAVPEETFAGAVTEFAAAVNRFGAESVLGPGSKLPFPSTTSPGGNSPVPILGPNGKPLTTPPGGEPPGTILGPDGKPLPKTTPTPREGYGGAEGLAGGFLGKAGEVGAELYVTSRQVSALAHNKEPWDPLHIKGWHKDIGHWADEGGVDVGRTAAAMWHGLFGGGNPTPAPSAGSTVTSASSQAKILMGQAAAAQKLANQETAAGDTVQAQLTQAVEAGLAAQASKLLKKDNPTTIYTTIQLDGKTIASVVQAQIKKQAARN
jgi:hypothetical protein